MGSYRPDRSDPHYQEYLILEDEVLGLVRRLEKVHQDRYQADARDSSLQSLSKLISDAHSTLGKADAAVHGLLPVSDTSWCLESTKRALQNALTGF